ncbi:MAG: hypothetical protein ACPGVT_04615 [Maricaulaceae bacterium]
MSANYHFKNKSLLATIAAGITLTACANGHASTSVDGAGIFKYEGAPHSNNYNSAQSLHSNLYKFEGVNSSCYTPACATPPMTTYTSSAHPLPMAPVIPPVAYPTHTYVAPTAYMAQSNHAAMGVDCPTNTTRQPDGTCLMNGSVSHGTTSYSSTTSYSQPTTYSSTTTSYGGNVNCPSGTSLQSNGTCMQGGSTSTSTTYGSGISSSHSTAVNCPTGTTRQPDGTCLQGGSISSGSTYTGYSSNSSSYSSQNYLPIRK